MFYHCGLQPTEVRVSLADFEEIRAMVSELGAGVMAASNGRELLMRGLEDHERPRLKRSSLCRSGLTYQR